MRGRKTVWFLAVCAFVLGLVNPALAWIDFPEDAEEPDSLVSEEKRLEKWDISVDIGFAQSQSTYSPNWDGEEEGTFQWTSGLNASAQKRISPRYSTRTTLKLEYGQSQTQDRDFSTWSAPAKTTDNIELESIFRFRSGGTLDPFAAGKIQSQFTDERIEETYYGNPVVFTESAGLAWAFWENIQNKHLIVRFGGALHQRYDINYIVDSTDSTEVRGKKIISDAGLEMVSEMVTPLIQDRVRLNAKITLFQSLHNSLSDELRNNDWRMVDADFEAIFTTRVTKNIAVKLNFRWMYDKEISPAGRFKELITLNLVYSLL